MLNDFLLKNWFDLLQSVFIIGGFALSYAALRNDFRSSRVEHLLQLNQSYREIWAKTYAQPELLRIKKSEVDLVKQPITETERRLVKEGILHMRAVYEAIQFKLLSKSKAEKDITGYLRLPIPNAIWQEVKGYHDRRFVSYIDSLLK
ncbi:MAG: hypothetical protein AAF901_01475 [Bacteroidota bacterium]